MSNIIPQIYKHKLPKELLYLVKYADIEECFSDCSTENVYLDVRFHHHQTYWKESREQLTSEGKYNIIRLNYSPDAKNVFPSSPWQGVENPTVVNISIYAVPLNILKISELDRVRLRRILVEQIQKLTPNNLFSDRWNLNITWLVKMGLLECVSQMWSGMRKEPETKLLLVLK